VPTRVHELRDALRRGISGGAQLIGTFLKLPAVDVVEMAVDGGLDFVVVDLEHSTLGERDGLALVRHADLCGIAAMVRVTGVDAGLINRLLENGAAGIQLSMLATAAQADALRAATRYAPHGGRSVSLANRGAAFGAGGLTGYLEREAQSPPVLVGQIETAATEPLEQLLPGLDVCFVGTTDLSVDLGLSPAQMSEPVGRIRAAAESAGVAFGGWATSLPAVRELGLSTAAYVVVGSDAQFVAGALGRLRREEST
jgi:4-hydroxy-2-oxoheptanedioate aldolase